MRLGELGRRRALILLLYASGISGRVNEPIEGRTRLTKMLFLLDKQNDVFRRVASLNFEAYAYGPFDDKIYDQLGWLANMGFLEGLGSDVQPSSAADATVDYARAYVDKAELPDADLSFDYLMGNVAESMPERYETIIYRLSQLGVQRARELTTQYSGDSDFANIDKSIRSVKSRFNQTPLHELLRYVYKTYPESAADSVIAARFGL